MGTRRVEHTSDRLDKLQMTELNEKLVQAGLPQYTSDATNSRGISWDEVCQAAKKTCTGLALIKLPGERAANELDLRTWEHRVFRNLWDHSERTTYWEIIDVVSAGSFGKFEADWEDGSMAWLKVNQTSARCTQERSGRRAQTHTQTPNMNL